MVSLYTGTPGSGKSYHVATDIIFFLNRGTNVIANFDIDMDYFKNKNKLGKFTYLNTFLMTPDYFKLYAKKNHKFKGTKYETVIIIDECSLIFNSRTFSQLSNNIKWIEFLQQHRKYLFDIILITQMDRLLDRQVRAFIETDFKHREIRNYNLFGKILSMFVGGHLFVVIEVWYCNKLIAGKRFLRLNKRKANIYNTLKLFDEDIKKVKKGDEKNAS